MRCAYCNESISVDEEQTEYAGECFHIDCLAWHQHDMPVANFEDERLDDPRHGLAAEINKIIR